MLAIVVKGQPEMDCLIILKTDVFARNTIRSFSYPFFSQLSRIDVRSDLQPFFIILIYIIAITLLRPFAFLPSFRPFFHIFIFLRIFLGHQENWFFFGLFLRRKRKKNNKKDFYIQTCRVM